MTGERMGGHLGLCGRMVEGRDPERLGGQSQNPPVLYRPPPLARHQWHNEVCHVHRDTRLTRLFHARTEVKAQELPWNSFSATRIQRFLCMV